MESLFNPHYPLNSLSTQLSLTPGTDNTKWQYPRCSFPEWLLDMRWRDLSGDYLYNVEQRGGGASREGGGRGGVDSTEVVDGNFRRRSAVKHSTSDIVYRLVDRG